MEAQDDPANSNPALLAIRNEFFRRCGRNMWLFQSVEAQLKGLAVSAYGHVSLHDTAASFHRRVARVKRQSMGELARGVVAAVLGQDGDDAASEDDLLRWSLRVEADGGFSDGLRSKLSALVVERNEVVHHAQAQWDITDESSMQAALIELDAQRERILIVHGELRRLVIWVHEAVQGMLRYLESPDFQLHWRQARLQQALLDAVGRAGRADGWSPLSQVGQHWRTAVLALPEDDRLGLPSLRRLLDECGWFEWREMTNPGGGSVTWCRLRAQAVGP